MELAIMSEQKTAKVIPSPVEIIRSFATGSIGKQRPGPTIGGRRDQAAHAEAEQISGCADGL